MSDDASRALDDDAQTIANMRLAARFIREALADPAILDAIPNGSSVVLLPTDDPDLDQVNRELARALAAAGTAVHTRVVGGAVGGAPLATIRISAIRLPAAHFHPEDLVAAISQLVA